MSRFIGRVRVRTLLPATLCAAALLAPGVVGCASTIGDDDAAAGDQAGGVQPGAMQNADGTFTNPDGSVVTADGTVISGAADGAGAGTSGAGTASTVAGADGTVAGATTPGVDGSQGGDGPDTSMGEPSNSNAGAGANCSGELALAPKRLVRLTFNQIANSLRDLLGQELSEQVAATYELPSATERTFPPLNNPREGSVIIDSQWQTNDAIARAAGEYVFDNFEVLSGCAVPASAECAREYVGVFAGQAFRRPLEADELTALGSVFDVAVEQGASAEVAAQHGVYAALSAPQFLYRTEFGADALIEGALSSFETASMLSYFLTDGPPDAQLRDAATQGQLATSEQIATHVDRLLQTPAARENLQAAMFSYFGISTLNTIVIDPEVAPQFTEGLRASMMRETELFINGTLWDGVVTDLLTSQESYVNQGLADLYGLNYPPAGAAPDEDGFALAMLPDNRSGILTQPGYLTTRSSPEEPSVVRRGLLVNASLLCATNPPFPEAQADEIDAVVESLDGASEREMVEYRASTPECGGCHIIFDAYGLGLDNFDVIGAYREQDPQGRPIDASVTLPSAAGGGTVTSPRQMAAALVESGAFTRCVSKNLLAYALAEGSTISANSCASKSVSDAFAATDGSFSSLIREVAKSTTFSSRTAGATE